MRSAPARAPEGSASALHDHFDGLYLSLGTDLRPERLNDGFPSGTLRHLRELKARYDPDDVFRGNLNVASDTRRS